MHIIIATCEIERDMYISEIGDEFDAFDANAIDWQRVVNVETRDAYDVTTITLAMYNGAIVAIDAYDDDRFACAIDANACVVRA